MAENPLIRYQGKEIRVTPDTAREFVDNGEAALISGKLSPVPKPEAVKKPKVRKKPSGK